MRRISTNKVESYNNFSGWLAFGSEGIERNDLASMAPYITERVKRFGEYPLDGLDKPPEAFDPHLELFVAAAQAA